MNVYVCTYIYIYIYPKNIWGIGNYADNYIDGSNNLSSILRLIHPLKNILYTPCLQNIKNTFIILSCTPSILR
jgi:hypothetical protein